MKTVLFSMIVAALLAYPCIAEDPWADSVVQYTEGPNALLKDPAKTLGAPVGGGPATPNNTSLVSLGGRGGSLTLRFNTPVEDDPANPFGLDCIVYANAFWVGANPQVKFQEPALIEISEDTNANGLADDAWYLIPGCRGYAYSPFPSVDEPPGQANSRTDPFLLAGNITNPNLYDTDTGNDSTEYNWGYAEMTPTMTPYLDNYVRPDDPLAIGITPRSGGGDAFDIAWAVDSGGNPAPITRFHFIRLTSFISRTLGALGTASPEIDAVADVAPDIDADADGILDDYELRVAGTDPTRAESTVLPLEIPPLEGGSPAGTLLGTAQDADGNKLRLYSSGQRTADGRAYNVLVDILHPTAPTGNLPGTGLVKSGAVVQITSSQSDWVAAGVAPAEVVIHYTSGDIAGLDESSLTPYRFNQGTYDQTGITGIQVNAAANLVSFRTQYAGVFVLVSSAGSGDIGGTEGPQGDILLDAVPDTQTVADPALSVSVTSSTIRDFENNPVADGTQITVAVSQGTIATPDADPAKSGVQVETDGSVISFSFHPSTKAGAVTITATSVQGAAYGELTYRFVAGPPTSAVGWTVGKPERDGPVDIPLASSLVTDQFGNPVIDGTLLTVDIVGGDITSGDADLSLPGHQVVVSNGRTNLTVQVIDNEMEFTIATYADEDQTALLSEEVLSGADYVPMPLRAGLVAVALFLAALMRLPQRKTKGGYRH